MKKIIRKLAFLLLVAAVCLAVCSCEKEPTVETTATTETTIPWQTQPLEYFLIETSYGTLKFPQQWKEDLTIEKQATETGEEVIFRETITKDQLTLFTICIGGTENGSYIGTLTDATGKTREVYLRINELDLGDDLSTEQKSRIYAMQESVNDIIDNLK